MGGGYTPQTLYCGDPAGPSWVLFHFDYAGPGTNCGTISGHPNDQPTKWYAAYHNGKTWKSPDQTHQVYYPPGSDFPTTTYAHMFRHPNQTEWVIQYWFFYPFNDWIANHEGDWEHINVIISSNNPETAVVDSVVYYFHERYKICNTVQTENPGGQFECYIEDGTHPVIFVGGHGEATEYGTGSGEGSHGCYPAWGRWEHVVLGSGYGFQFVDQFEVLDGNCGW
jgi:hypothetical protein